MSQLTENANIILSAVITEQTINPKLTDLNNEKLCNLTGLDNQDLEKGIKELIEKKHITNQQIISKLDFNYQDQEHLLSLITNYEQNLEIKNPSIFAAQEVFKDLLSEYRKIKEILIKKESNNFDQSKEELEEEILCYIKKFNNCFK